LIGMGKIKSLVPIGVWSLVHQAHIKLLYWLHYPGCKIIYTPF
jgi:hypothetical protein